jgi:hypothetical protein
MSRIEQIEELNASELADNVFLRVIGVRGSFKDLCEILGIQAKCERDDLDLYEYATLKLDDIVFQIEQYRREENGYALLLLSGNSNIRRDALKVIKALGLNDGEYTFVDQGYKSYKTR